MNTANPNSNPVIIAFWSLPSCSMLKSYKAHSDALGKAIKHGHGVEIATRFNTVLKFREIGIEAGRYFGLEGLGRRLKKTMLNINDIKSVTLL